MNDLITMESTPAKIFFNLLLFVIAFIVSNNDYKRNSKSVRLVWLISFVFCIFSFYGGDYFHYWETFVKYKSRGINWVLEEIYEPIMDFSPYYLVFRAIIWGGGLLCYYWASQILRIDRNLLSLLFVVYLLLSFSYARASLALSILMLGYALLVCPANFNILRITIGVILIGISTIFHRSATLPAFIAILSIIKLRRWQLATLIVALPIIIKVLDNNLYTIMTMSGALDEEQVNKATHYLSDNAQKQRGIASLINFFLQFVTTYFGSYLVGKAIFNAKNKLSNLQKRLATFSIGVIYTATVFWFIPNAFVLFYRILAMAKFPLLFELCLLDKILPQKDINRFIFLCLLSASFQLSYSLYLSIVQ